ncbi:MAG: aspartate 1-decarboxylase [Candidatus Omnitrophica bacterium]|nr:aspartate 1-decarboxylase [Candidatus Omnitrophota bacterium]
MQIEILKSKIFRATVTETRPDYEGSITIDTELMKAVGLEKNEKVLVANFTSGERFETYAIPAPAGSRTICINGAATHLARVGHEVIIMSFCSLTKKEYKKHRPKIVHLGKDNRIISPRASHAEEAVRS